MSSALPPSALVLALALVACGRGSEGRTPVHPWDVSGNYRLRYDNQVTMRLFLGGGVREATVSGYSGVVDFGVVAGQPLRLDLLDFCERPEVDCPSETWWPAVAIDQLDVDRDHPTHVINVVDNTNRTLPVGERAEALGGLVSHAQADEFIVGLGVSGGAGTTCAALGLSVARGRFTREGERYETVTGYQLPDGGVCPQDGGSPGQDAGLLPGACVESTRQVLRAPPGARVNGIAEGRVGIGWLGGCVFGPVVATAAVTLETGFSGFREGNFNPPPFTPVPARVPDAGFPDGGAQDAGVADGG